MKKTYEKPTLLCEELRPEEMLCACKYKNPEFNEEWHCGYSLPNLPNIPGMKIFVDGWTNCNPSIPNQGFCYHTAENNLFGS